MKILEINKYYYNRRGAELYMLNVIEALEEAGHETAIFSMRHPQNIATPWSQYFVDYLDTDSLRLLQVPRYIGRALWSTQAHKRVRALIDAFQPDIVHAHNVYTHLSPAVLKGCASKHIPVVLTVHDYGLISGNYALWSGTHSLYPDHMDFASIVRSKYIKQSYIATATLEIISRIHRYFRLYDRYIDTYIAVSGAVQEVLIWAGVDARKIQVLHNFAQAEPLPRADMPRGFFFYGSLESNKGIATLLEAAKDCKEPVYIAGKGPLQKEVERAGAPIQYLGTLTSREIFARLATVRAAVFPSISREVYSTATLEALLSGTPVIVSDAGGFTEMVQHGAFGSVFRAGDSGQLRTAMDFVLRHPQLVEDRARHARDWIMEHEGKDSHMRRLTEIFENVIAHKKMR